MKQVLQEVTDKNGNISIKFNATAKMILFAIGKAKNPSWSDNEVLDDIGIHRNSLSQWKTKYGSHFTSFIEEMIDNFAPDKGAELLEAVGMVNALQGNYNFWKDLAKTRGVIKEDAKSVSLTINTSFEHISLGDFNEQRARLLSELRGVGVSGKSGVAEPVTIEHKASGKGPGNRAGKVQTRSVAFLDTLGSDRRCNGTTESIPAVSQQEAPTSDDSLLAEYNEAVLSKK